MFRRGRISFKNCNIWLHILLLILLQPMVGATFEAITTQEGLILVQDSKDGQKSAMGHPEGDRNPFMWPPELIEKHRKLEDNNVKQIFEQLQLTGIIWDETEPMAIIDDTLVREGEWVNGVRVRTIFRNEVLLEQNSQHHFIKFEELLELENFDASSEKQTGGSNG